MAVKKKKTVKKKVKKKKASTKKKSAVSKKRAPAKKAGKSAKKKSKTAAKKTVKKAKVKKKPKTRSKKTPVKKAASKKAAKKSVSKKAVQKIAPKVLAKKTAPKKTTKKVVEPPEEIIKPFVKSPFKQDDPKILKIQERLIQERKRLMGMLRSSKEVERTINDITFSNEIDLASSLEGREMAFQLSSRDRDELRLVEDAIFKIKGNTYGVCDNCSKYITLKRLEIMPLTALCIACQENLEVR